MPMSLSARELSPGGDHSVSSDIRIPASCGYASGLHIEAGQRISRGPNRTLGTPAHSEWLPLAPPAAARGGRPVRTV
jgi:hypothetical protein